MLSPEIIIVPTKLFELCKPVLNEKCFWREHPQGIEIKFDPLLKKLIPQTVLTLLQKNKL